MIKYKIIGTQTYSNLVIEAEERPVIGKTYPPSLYPSEKDTLALLPNLSKFCQQRDPCAFYRRAYVPDCKTFACDTVLPDIELENDLIKNINIRNRKSLQKLLLKTPPMAPCLDDLHNIRRTEALLSVQRVMVALQYYATGTFQSFCGDGLEPTKPLQTGL
uniref:Uncharacterized protein n=1 Tax=Romanomermis culicivorax TaxID=13658 RepID=A0A915HWH4_ROMCU